nr:MAG TPA: internal head protein [Caudoviricetes sp.]
MSILQDILNGDLDFTREEDDSVVVNVNTDEETKVDDETPPEGYEEVETTTDADGEETIESDDLETELLEVQEEANDIEQAEAKVDEAEDAAIATEALLANLVYASQHGGLNYAHADAIRVSTESIVRSLGMADSDIPHLDFGRESFTSTSAVALSTETAMESVKNFFVKILDGILKGIAWIVDKGMALVTRLFSNFEKLQKRANAISAALNKLPANAKPKKDTIKSAGIANALTIDGKVASGSECVGAIRSALDEIISNWQVKAISATALKEAKEAYAKMDKEAKGAWNVAALEGMSKELPFTSKGTELSKDAAAKRGIKLKDGETCRISDILPRNKAVVTIVGTHDSKLEELKQPRTVSRVVSVKPASTESRDIDVKIPGKAEIANLLKGVTGLLRDLQKVKNGMESALPAIKALKGEIWNLRKKYVAVTKEGRGNRGFIDNNSFVRGSINIVKASITNLREPGRSFLTYALFELKGLLDFANASVKAYAAGSGNLDYEPAKGK